MAIADEVAPTLAQAVAGADLVILCVPVGADDAVAQEIGPHLKRGAIVSDVGSVKSAVIGAIAPHLPAGVSLVPAHPVAGTEQSGPDAGFDSLVPASMVHFDAAGGGRRRRRSLWFAPSGRRWGRTSKS